MNTNKLSFRQVQALITKVKKVEESATKALNRDEALLVRVNECRCYLEQVRNIKLSDLHLVV